MTTAERAGLAVAAAIAAIVVIVAMAGGRATDGGTRGSAARAIRAPASSGTANGAAAARTAFLPAPASSARDSLGINSQFLFPLLPRAAWGVHLREMRDAGMQLARVAADWGDAEATAPDAGGHHYSWGYFDEVAGSLAAVGISWLPVVELSAPWAASVGGTQAATSPPRYPEMFVQFAAAFAARYGPGGAFWRSRPDLPAHPVRALEIWNEENSSGFWYPTPAPAVYLDLYERSRAAIHRVSPQIEVLVGGLTNPSAAYLGQLYVDGEGRTNLFDGVAIHPYAPTPQGVLQEVVRTRSVLDLHGDVDVPIDVTEFGWPTRGALAGGLPNLADPARATALAQITSTLARSDCGVERILPHTWVTLERKPGNAEDWFGLVHPNGALSASASAYASIVHGFEQQPQPAASVQLCGRSLTVGATVKQTPAAGTTPSGRRHLALGCLTVIVSGAGAALDRAIVQLSFTPAAGRTQPLHALLTRRTNATGAAAACFRAKHAMSGTVRVTASRADFAAPASTQLPLRIS